MDNDRSVEGVFQIDIERIFRVLYDLLTNADGSSGVAFLRSIWDFLNFISIFLAPILLFGIIYATIRLNQVLKDEQDQFQDAVRRVGTAVKGDERWQRVMRLVNGDNPTEWRHAIIEADVMLDEILTSQGYVGDTLGEKLKAVPQERLQTLQAAWEAHKVRNEIAHSGSDFILSQREARRAIENYRQVFSEFGML